MKLRCLQTPLLVWFDPDKLEKIVINLLGNAFKFTPAGGKIEVELAVSRAAAGDDQPESPGDIRIAISDSGAGIAPEHLPHIFNRFYRASKSVSGEQGGTGIGLALVKEFVELHRGDIAVASVIGKGSTFTVTLPLGRDHLADDEIVEPTAEVITPDHLQADTKPVSIDDGSSSLQQHGPVDATAPCILVVEDNADMRRYIKNCLAQYFNIVEAVDGQSGFRTACAQAPDLLVSDVMMPKMDGFELCEKLKTDARTSHIPVVMLTARAEMEDRLEGLETGADDYLTKPFNAQELLVRAKNLIEQRRRLQARFRNALIINPSEVTATSMDAAFLQKVMQVVENNLGDSQFETDHLARQAGYSRRQLNRKLRALTGYSVREFIRIIRLKRASQLLQQHAGTVTEIAFEVGFNSLAHFAKIYRRQFGIEPSKYGGKNL